MNKSGKIAIRLITFSIVFASGFLIGMASCVVFLGLVLCGLYYFAQS